MKSIMRKNGLGLLLALLTLMSVLFVGCGGSTEKNMKADIDKFYQTVVSSQECLDIVADDIYRNWYDAIYKDKYGGSIDLAIAYAQVDNEENLKIIKDNDAIIKELYKKVRDSAFEDEIKEVMSAYSDYYEFVVNVSGSFNSFSASKETLKKELASAVKDLQLEI